MSAMHYDRVIKFFFRTPQKAESVSTPRVPVFITFVSPFLATTNTKCQPSTGSTDPPWQQGERQHPAATAAKTAPQLPHIGTGAAHSYRS